ncbi:mitochondrial amidoxime reducing component 2-like [Pieris brassicae]|uniref:mitochondrial amidoxime reducing component 2-like n=1 Tax=Pieris brassicae TaxID=7116 RepID=UPI001E65EB73|nr:mitochondrial amidoxime reducing component 2-like [Pieris brassicae]
MSQAIYVSTAVGVGVVGGLFLSYHMFKKVQNKTKIPEQWIPVGTLKNLLVYPIKSCAPILLNTAECTSLGLKDNWLRDRFLMVTDSNYHFLTARKHPNLLLVYSSFEKFILTLKHKDMEPLRINLDEVIELQKPQSGDVWGTKVPIYDCGWAASDWFSRLLGSTENPMKLVLYASKKSRKLAQSNLHNIYNFGSEDTGVFTDDTTYNLINEASVNDVKQKAPNSDISIRNFRPNFVLTGAKPFEEDNWRFVKIGSVVFEIIMPCFRCVLTTINPETGVPDTNSEPLETLRSYRLHEDPQIRKSIGNSPRMGVQMALRSPPGGTVNINDTIYIA